jgi:NADH-quinone oxidoreductase subunit L
LPRLGVRIRLPLVVLAVLSVVVGLVDLPRTLGNLPLLSDLLHSVLPAAEIAAEGVGTELLFQVIAGVVSLGGVYLAYLLILRQRQVVEGWTASPLGSALHRLWFAGWGFDWLYDTLLVGPYVWIARANRRDVVDLFYEGLARLVEVLHGLLSRTQTGRVRWYAAGLVLGAVVVIALVVLL